MIGSFSIMFFLFFALLLGVLLFQLMRALLPEWKRRSARVRWSFWALVAATAVLLLRPHEDAFVGLDTSCYRLMTQAFQNNRGFRETDRVLREAPETLRRFFLLKYNTLGRDTRDRSFEIPNLSTCATQPFFYPSLPLAAAGLGRLLPGNSSDYFVPGVGLVFCIALFLVGAARGGGWGLFVAMALLVGTPLPAWLLRGFFGEAVGGVMVALVLLAWLIPLRGLGFLGVAACMLGLAVCFHPAMIVAALPALLLLLASECATARTRLLVLAMFGLGLLPLIQMTRFICHPYGDFLDWQQLVHRLRIDAVVRLVLAFMILSLLAGVACLAILNWAYEPIRRWFQRLSDNRALSLGLVVLGILPAWILTHFWSKGTLVVAGWHELLSGVRWGYGALLIVVTLGVMLCRRAYRAKLLIWLAFAILPFFLYLKGFEQVGMWSQRRLLPMTLWWIVALTPAGIAFLALIKTWPMLVRRLAYLSLALLFVVAALANPLRWPAPYLVRFDRGADACTVRMKTIIAGRLTLFDYHHYTLPLAVNLTNRVLGLSEQGYPALAEITRWVRERAQQEDVLWCTAFANPGIEDGVALVPEGRQKTTLPRLLSKTALPAIEDTHVFNVEFLRVVPAQRLVAPPVLHKVFDGGPLALRGLWGRNDIALTTADGKKMCACWSREGSGVIGPVPPAKGSVELTIIAVSGQAVPRQLIVEPPWTTNRYSLLIGIQPDPVTLHINRTAGTEQTDGPTGNYRLFAAMPFNPALQGIHGFDSDLGALIHSITIRVVPPPIVLSPTCQR